MLSNFTGLLLFCYVVWYAITGAAEEKFNGFFNETALILLLVAPIGIVLMSRNVLDLISALKTILTMSFVSIGSEMKKVANLLSGLSSEIRLNGMGALAKRKKDIKNPFFREGITLILNSFTAEEIKHNLIAKINTEQAQLSQVAGLFEALGKLSPAIGLLGTLVGLVQMLANLSDPSKIGPGMAVSLLATLYGLVLGNAVYLPLADKVENHMGKKLQLDTMIMEGILLLKEKKSGAHMSDMVSIYGTHRQNKDNKSSGEQVATKNGTSA